MLVVLVKMSGDEPSLGYLDPEIMGSEAGAWIVPFNCGICDYDGAESAR